MQSLILPDHESLNRHLRDLLLERAGLEPDRVTNNPAGTSYFVNKWLSVNTLQREPEFAELVARIEAVANEAAWPGVVPGTRLRIYAMWAIVSRQGLEGDRHTHHGVLSGAYYVSPGDGSGGELEVHAHADAPPECVRPEAGLLLLFPSDLPHGVRRYSGERPRVVISFNLTDRPDKELVPVSGETLRSSPGTPVPTGT